MNEPLDHSGLTRQRVLFTVIPALLSVLIYLPSLNNGFVWDAAGVFVHDPSIRSLGNIPGFFVRPSPLPGIPGDSNNLLSNLQYYRPVMKTVHALEYQLFKDRPFGYNAVNIAVNAVVVLLAVLLVRSLTGNGTIAFLAGLLYAVNPSRVEAVSWSYSDSYLFAALFLLLSFNLYRNGHFGRSLAFFTFALLTHESAVLFPFLLFLHEHLVRDSREVRAYLRPAVLLLILGAFLAVRRLIAGPTPVTSLDALPFFSAIAVIIKRYLKLLFVPDAPIAIYAYREGMFSALSPEIIVSYGVLVCLIAIGIFLWFRSRQSLFWYLWFFLLSSLSFNVGAFGEYLIAEKLLYLASLGICTLIALPAATARRGRTVLLALVLCLVVYHMGTTVHRQRFYKDTRTYLKQILASVPDFFLPHIALAFEYEHASEYDKALGEFRWTLMARPGLFPLLRPRIANIHYLKGNVLSDQKRYAEALESYETAISWKNDLSPVYNNMGNIYMIQGERQKAFEAWRLAVRYDPTNAPAHFNMALEYQRRGNTREALVHYRIYLDLSPGRHAQSKDLVGQLRSEATRQQLPEVR